MIDKDLSHIHLLRASGYFDRSSVTKDLQRCLTDTDKTLKDFSQPCMSEKLKTKTVLRKWKLATSLLSGAETRVLLVFFLISLNIHFCLNHFFYSYTVPTIIINMKKLLSSDWLR